MGVSKQTDVSKLECDRFRTGVFQGGFSYCVKRGSDVTAHERLTHTARGLKSE